MEQQRRTIAPYCVAKCGRQIDNPPDQEPWFVISGHHVKPETDYREQISRDVRLLICPECRDDADKMAPIAEFVSDIEVYRLPDNSPGTVLGIIRGIPDDVEES